MPAGFEIRLSLEAVIGFVNRMGPWGARQGYTRPEGRARRAQGWEMSADLIARVRSLRIAADETQEKESE